MTIAEPERAQVREAGNHDRREPLDGLTRAELSTSVFSPALDLSLVGSDAASCELERIGRVRDRRYRGSPGPGRPSDYAGAWYAFDVLSTPLPDCVRRLLWDVDPETVDLVRDADYVMERVMTRGTWEAMRWLRAQYESGQFVDFLQRRGERLSARDRAYWSLVSGRPTSQEAGGGRPVWAR